MSFYNSKTSPSVSYKTCFYNSWSNLQLPGLIACAHSPPSITLSAIWWISRDSDIIPIDIVNKSPDQSATLSAGKPI